LGQPYKLLLLFSTVLSGAMLSQKRCSWFRDIHHDCWLQYRELSLLYEHWSYESGQESLCN